METPKEGRMQKILIVDDSPMMLRIVERIVREAGYDVIRATDGKAGVEKARLHRPNLVIMDVEMPVMDGFTATSILKDDPETAHLPVIILTSLGSEEDYAAARSSGAERFLNKPVSRDELLETIRELLDF